jgi:hypothetical protein
VIATDGGALAGPDRPKPSRDSDPGKDRDDHDVDPDDDVADDEGRDRDGLPWWQRALYGAADRWQGGWGALTAPLRRPATPDYEVGVDGEHVPPAPPDVLDVLDDAHTPADSHEWPEPRASDYEWPAEPGPAQPSANSSPHASPHPLDQHEPVTRSTAMTVSAREFKHHFAKVNDQSTPQQVRAAYVNASQDAYLKSVAKEQEARDMFADAEAAVTETSKAELKAEASKLEFDSKEYAKLASHFKARGEQQRQVA